MGKGVSLRTHVILATQKKIRLNSRPELRVIRPNRWSEDHPIHARHFPPDPCKDKPRRPVQGFREPRRAQRITPIAPGPDGNKESRAQAKNVFDLVSRDANDQKSEIDIMEQKSKYQERQQIQSLDVDDSGRAYYSNGEQKKRPR